MTRPPAQAHARAKPVLFVTGHAPPDRVGAFARLHELENVEFALFGGRSKHAGPAPARDLPFPHRHIRQHEPALLAASGRYRAVVCSTGGRLAPLATWAGARRAGLPLILWTALWAHPRSAAHALSFLALRRLYRSADAVVTYGSHVSAYVGARGARNVYIAPQAVDNAFWRSADISAPRVRGWPQQAETKFLFAGRPAREKGLRVLTEAWRTTGQLTPTAALVLVGVGPNPPWAPAGGAAVGLPRRSSLPARRGEPSGAGRNAAGSARDGAQREQGQHGREQGGQGEPGEQGQHAKGGNAGRWDAAESTLWMDPVPPVELRNLFAACDVLVVPSIATRTFREPWSLVVNEAMNRGLPVIASDAVGAAAGGLVRDGRNGLVVPAGDSEALARAIRRLAADPTLREQLGRAGAQDVLAFSYDAWATGFSRALAGLGLSRRYS